MRTLRALLFTLLLAASPSASVSAQQSPSIAATLRASFPAPPYLLELLETAAAENTTAYLPLLDAVATTPSLLDLSATDEQRYATFTALLIAGGHLADSGARAGFDFALGLRAAAPRVEAGFQFYREAVGAGKSSAAVEVWSGNGARCEDVRCEKVVGGEESGHTGRRLGFDRVFGVENGEDVRTAYVDVDGQGFAEGWREFRKGVKEAGVGFRVRYKPSSGQERREKLVVNGYGVELALKRTDYIVIDDRGQQGEEKGGEKRAPSDEERTKLNLKDEAANAAPIADVKPLSQSELLDLGLKSASYIMSSAETDAERLKNLVRISQDFPRYAAALVAHNTSSAFIKEHNANRASHALMGSNIAPAGRNIMWLNGVQISPREVDAFNLLETIRRERNLIRGIKDLGFSAPDSIALLSHEALAEAQSGDEPQRYEFRDYIEGGGVVIWFNDILKDKRYNDWPETIQALLQRTFPGQLPMVRKDLHTVIFPVDFTMLKDVSLIIEQIQMLIQRGIAIRFGVVPRSSTEEAVEQAKVIYHLQEAYGLGSIMDYLQTAASNSKLSKPDYTTFDAVTRSLTLRKNQTALTIPEISESSHIDARIKKAQAYLSRLGADGDNPPLFGNGVAIANDEEWMQNMGERITMDLRIAQEAVIQGTITEDDWIPRLWMKDASLKRNALIIPENENDVTLFDIGKLWSEFQHIIEPRTMPATDPYDASEFASMMIIADLSTSATEMVIDAFEMKKEHKGLELTIVPNPLPSSEEQQDRVVKEAKERFPDSVVPQFLQKVIRRTEESSANGDSSTGPAALAQAVGLKPGQTSIVLNGRLIGPIPEGKRQLSKDDLFTLVSYEQKKRIQPAVATVKALGHESKLDTPLAVAQLSSLVGLATVSDGPEGIFDRPSGPRIDGFESWNSSHTAIEIGDKATASLQFVVALNPASEVGQRWVHMLSTLAELDGLHLRIFLNPEGMLEELPIKRFYRHVLHSRPHFSEKGWVRDLRGEFLGMPEEALLTMGLDVPPSWLVAPSECVHDPDNIKLSSLKADKKVEAVYELEHILIEGHSRDLDKGSAPPRGAQLVLGTDTNPAVAGTIVMSNLGYFQFKANPGVFNLALQKGPSQDIFHIDSAGTLGYSPQPGDESTEITLSSFLGATIFPRLSRKPGKERTDVLEAESEKPSEGVADQVLAKAGLKDGKAGEYLSKGFSFGQNVLSKAGLSGTALAPGPKHADINIFSVASGHLYERMLNIMMVSVMRHTNSTVKFWFIEQFLSPSFKTFLPHLAEAYNFRYEMVTYKWPHWLRAQTEKQRVIWGYKILFLDVLFPLDLDRVIFVDADQIVRTDLLTLTQLPLIRGAPYAFTPMCDSRTEMEGFRFWKKGYWKEFLRGRPYHISALYLVDLRRFRAMAAGDRLRGQYHQLSADPNSLANLDQDLPNHMQMSIPIHSLSQEWLWCETWCSDEALADAKTIDLCNNPQTKEPKLDRARRQVPEWTVYDEEIAALARRVEAQGNVGAETGAGEGSHGGLGDRPKEERKAEEGANRAPADEDKAETKRRDEL